MEPLDCTGCTECCNWLTFIVQFLPEGFDKGTDLYSTRGCQLQTLSGEVAITVPTTCQHLTPEGCSIHNSKPKACKDYDCRRDPFLKGGKYGSRKEK